MQAAPQSRDAARNFSATHRITACRRCHSKKIKCTGGKPCQNCLQAEAGATCLYPERNRTLKVPQRYIDGLFEEIERLKQQVNAGNIPDRGPPNQSQIHVNTPHSLPRQPEIETTGPDQQEINPPFGDRPWFDNRNVFHTPILIGEAADAAFATRFRQVISDPQVPEPSHLLRVNYANNETLAALGEAGTTWPTQSRGRFLLDAALKYIGRCHLIVRPSKITDELTQIFCDPTRCCPTLRCKFWALFAIGELYTTKVASSQGYPGMSYFAQASKIHGYFEERPGMDYIETFLLLSIYSLALNRRYSAYILSGTAMRAAIVTGLHLKMPESQLPDLHAHEDRKRLFWSAYIFDRMWGVNLGHPAAIQDDEIEIDLPAKQDLRHPISNGEPASNFSDGEYQRASINLVSHFTSVIRSVYSIRRPHLGRLFSTRVHHALQSLQDWVDNLPPHLQIDRLRGSNDLNVVSLHLSFYQCVILATRPILLHMIRVQVMASRAGIQPPSAVEVSAGASALSEACIRFARHSAQLLMQSWIEGSFVTFDCFFTQYLFSSLTVLAVSSILNGKDSAADRSLFEGITHLLNQLKEAGSHVAHEYCHHVDAVTSALTSYDERMAAREGTVDIRLPMNQQSEIPEISHGLPQGISLMDDMARTESSLEGLLSQPALDIQFLEDAVRDNYSQGLYQFGFDYAS